MLILTLMKIELHASTQSLLTNLQPVKYHIKIQPASWLNSIVAFISIIHLHIIVYIQT